MSDLRDRFKQYQADELPVDDIPQLFADLLNAGTGIGKVLQGYAQSLIDLLIIVWDESKYIVPEKEDRWHE